MGNNDNEKEGIPKIDIKHKLELSEDMKNILESSYDGIWITDGEGRVLYTNSANERITGFKREQVLGRHTQEMLDKKLFSKSAVLQVLKSHKRVTMMGYNYNTNKHVLITGNPIFNDDGKIKYVVNNIRDITDLEKLTQELKSKDNIINQQKTELEHLRSLQMNFEDEGIIVNSLKMRRVFQLAQRVAKFDSTVLILGESGSGKEVIAESIVRASKRKDKPFIKVNCGAIPHNLLESELFGYVKGAFTGASSKGKPGMFEMADKGTIFLDEVADLPLNLQVKLLRVIQQKEIIRLGGTDSIKLDVRIIAATNKNVEDMVTKGTFREDLFYRLNVITIMVPPLRERIEDIPALANFFLKKYNAKFDTNKTISPEAIDVFTEYKWPGNVRELENIIENIVVMTQEETIYKEHIPPKILRKLDNKFPDIEVNSLMPLKEAVNKLEEDLLKKAIKKYGTTRKAAEVLKVDQSTIVRKMKKLNLIYNE